MQSTIKSMFLGAAILTLGLQNVAAAEDASCKTVRFADVRIAAPRNMDLIVDCTGTPLC